MPAHDLEVHSLARYSRHAIVLTAGHLGSSVAPAISQAVFAGRLKRNIRLQLQVVDSDVIINAGATDLRNLMLSQLYERELQLCNMTLT